MSLSDQRYAFRELARVRIERDRLRAALERAERWLRQANCMMEAQDIRDELELKEPAAAASAD